MTPLDEILRARIVQSGPMPVGEYMATSLGHPQHGYYITRDPLGAAGDFTTAPEISQMFGEMVGLWLVQAWQAAGSPERVSLVELGPGRGTLMADILRAARVVPAFLDAAEVAMVETSPTLRSEQARRVPGASWIEDIADLPGDLPVLAVANEFFDALPVRQYVRSETAGWCERVVGLTDGALAFGLGPEGANPIADARFGDADPGTVVEVSAAGEAIAARLGEVIGRAGGAALIIDYGDWEGVGDTLQAVRDHAPVSPLDRPGTADLTAHVGFRWLAEAAMPIRARYATQGAFLERLGITPRANALARVGDADAIAAQHKRLTHPDEMGSLFKVMTLSPPDMPPLPGFET